MPQLVTLKIKRRGHRAIRLWIPVLLAVVLLSPVLLLALIGGVIACRILHMRVFATIAGVGRFIGALSGSRFDIEQGGTALLLTFR